MMRPFFRGLLDSLSIGIGYIPVAASFGLAAVHADVSPLMAIFISIVVYAGASQFILISLIASGSSAVSIVAIVLLMNLRHVFYGPVVIGKLDATQRRFPAFLLAAGLTDEVFAASVSKLGLQPAAEREPWYAGLQLGAYSCWVLGTGLGAYIGHDLLRQSVILSQTLSFVLPALFFALLLEIRKITPLYVLIATAIATWAAIWLLPAYGAIVVGMLVGAFLAGRRG